MKPEGDLITLKLPGVAEFSIVGPLPEANLTGSPALARTILISMQSGTSAMLTVLSELIEGNPLLNCFLKSSMYLKLEKYLNSVFDL